MIIMFFVYLEKVVVTTIDQIINGITDTLKDQGVEKIILFGSYAYGEPTEDSDLDIIVVTNDNFLPATNREKMELHHKYNLLIRKFRKVIPIDMLVYTKLMYQKVQESGNLFTREINQKGKILYEAADKGMA
jgi:predicted nucleotidyltransferase